MHWAGFVGPSAVNRSVNANAERTINLYPEKVDGTGKTPAVLHGTPGLAPFVNLGASPIRALFAQDGRAFAVAGARFVELFATGTAILRGVVSGDASPATISSNGTGGEQLFITAAGLGYIFALDTNVFTPLIGADIPNPIGMGAFSDGYFLATVAQSATFRLSSLEDGLTWDPLDVQQRSYSTDVLQALVVNHRELWLFGSRTTEVWYDSGDADTPFQPIAGAFIESGTAAPWTVVRCDNALLWVGEDERGAGVVWRANGYTPQRISTHPLELRLASVPLANARAFSYQDEGHLFYWLYVPGLDTSWVYDIATGLWHERAHWDEQAMRWIPHVAVCHCWAFDRHLVGARDSGAIYELDLGLYDDEIAE